MTVVTPYAIVNSSKWLDGLVTSNQEQGMRDEPLAAFHASNNLRPSMILGHRHKVIKSPAQDPITLCMEDVYWSMEACTYVWAVLKSRVSVSFNRSISLSVLSTSVFLSGQIIARREVRGLSSFETRGSRMLLH